MGKENNNGEGNDQIQKQIDQLKKQTELEVAKKAYETAKDANKPVQLSDKEKEKKQIEDQKAIETAKKDIAEAQQKQLKAMLPEVETKALEGKITIDANVTSECQMLTYKALSETADHIAKEILTNDCGNLLICNQSDFEILNMYKTFLEQIKLLKNEYAIALKEEEIVKPELEGIMQERIQLQEAVKANLLSLGDIAVPAMQIPEIAATAVKSVIDFVALFRTDTEMKGNKFDITNEPLIAEIARYLKKHNKKSSEAKEVKLFYPPFKNIGKSSLLKCVVELGNEKEKADSKINAQPKGEKPDEKITRLIELNAQYDRIIKLLWTIDEKTGSTFMDKLIRGSVIDEIFNTSKTDILYLKILSAGGNNRIKRNLLWTSITHSGNIVVQYFIIGIDGMIKNSKTFYNSTGYKKFKGSVEEVELNNFGK